MIKDIEPLEEIVDYSLYITLVLALFLFSIFYFLILNLKKKKPTLKEITLKRYKEIDFKNPKKDAYDITKYANILATNPKSKEIKERLLKKLEIYKYKKNVPSFDSEAIALYNLFLEVVENE